MIAPLDPHLLVGRQDFGDGHRGRLPHTQELGIHGETPVGVGTGPAPTFS